MQLFSDKQQSTQVSLSVDIPHSSFRTVVRILHCHGLISAFHVDIVDAIFLYYRGIISF